MTAPSSGRIEHVVAVMFDRRPHDDLASGTLPISAYLAHQFLRSERPFDVAGTSIASSYLVAHCGRDDAFEPNVFSALDALRPPSSRPNWKLYFHDYSILGDALPYVARRYGDAANVNVANYDECDYPPGARNPLAHPSTTFLQDVAQGTLPAYAFIEPRHGRLAEPVALVPGAADAARVPALGPDPFDGERLLAEVYLALRSARYWERTLLIVVGPVVPAIVVSAYVEPGSEFAAGAPFVPASILRTVWEAFGLSAEAPLPLSPPGSAPSLLPYLAPAVVNDPAGGAELEANAAALR